MPVNDPLQNKYERLLEIIGRHSKAALACSGGVDSTFLLKCASEVLGPDEVIALLACSPLQPQEETANAHAVINEIGCRLLTVELDPFSWPEFVENPPDRCYHCKKKIYTLFFEKMREHNVHVLMDGTNLDDLSDYRPGLQALKELGVLTPLVEAKLGKNEIRSLSRSLKLSNWDRPSSSCLATRIPAGRRISLELIQLAARCEEHLKQLGFIGCRVRLTVEGALVELTEDDIEIFAREPNRVATERFFSDLGLKRVFLNIRGREPVRA